MDPGFGRQGAAQTRKTHQKTGTARTLRASSECSPELVIKTSVSKAGPFQRRAAIALSAFLSAVARLGAPVAVVYTTVATGTAPVFPTSFHRHASPIFSSAHP